MTVFSLLVAPALAGFPQTEADVGTLLGDLELTGEQVVSAREAYPKMAAPECERKLDTRRRLPYQDCRFIALGSSPEACRALAVIAAWELMKPDPTAAMSLTTDCGDDLSTSVRHNYPKRYQLQVNQFQGGTSVVYMHKNDQFSTDQAELAPDPEAEAEGEGTPEVPAEK
jgi:hypothetical protein